MPASQPGLHARLPWLLIAAGIVSLYAPVLVELFRTVWDTTEQAHGPIVLAVGAWLLYRDAGRIDALRASMRGSWSGWILVALALAMYFLGRAHDMSRFEVASAILLLAGVLVIMRGFAALGVAWFALFFLLFMIPLPAGVVIAVTSPMKLAVSYVAQALLFHLGFPVARSGVILQVGPYQLLVADACAGLHTLFSLEAMGLLYLNLVRHASPVRTMGLGLLLVPISFTANVARVAILCLVTLYFGDGVGQGFIHGFAGMVLYVIALLLLIGADSLLRLAPHRTEVAPA